MTTWKMFTLIHEQESKFITNPCDVAEQLCFEERTSHILLKFTANLIRPHFKLLKEILLKCGWIFVSFLPSQP